MTQPLNLSEEFALVSLRDQGLNLKYHYLMYRDTYAVGAVFTELLLNGIITLDEKGTVILAKEGKTGVSYLDLVIEELAKRKEKPKRLRKWILTFYYKKRLRRRVIKAIMEQLQAKEAVQEKETRILFVPKTTYVANEDARERVIQKIRAELLENGKVDEEAVALTLLLGKIRLLKDYFSKYEAGQLEAKLKEIKDGDYESLAWLNEVDKAIAEVEAAIGSAAAAAAT